MEKTYFLCLANSKKYGERCIAGVKLTPDKKGQFHPVFKNEIPEWLRPVTAHEHGQVPAARVQHVKVGDIVSFQVVRAMPSAYQTENILFEPDSLLTVRPAHLSEKHLQQLAEETADLFGNRLKCLTGEEITGVNRSLVFIRAEQVKAYFKTPYNTQPRISFRYGGALYDLPMTDVNFFDRMQEDKNILDGSRDAFLTISLGVIFEGKYYKLAAGVLLW